MFLFVSFFTFAIIIIIFCVCYFFFFFWSLSHFHSGNHRQIHSSKWSVWFACGLCTQPITIQYTKLFSCPTFCALFCLGFGSSNLTLSLSRYLQSFMFHSMRSKWWLRSSCLFYYLLRITQFFFASSFFLFRMKKRKEKRLSRIFESTLYMPIRLCPIRCEFWCLFDMHKSRTLSEMEFHIEIETLDR